MSISVMTSKASAPVGNYTVRVLTNLDELDGVSEAWDALFAQASGASPYQSRAWLCAWLRGRAEGRTMSVYCVHRGKQLVAMLPLMRASKVGLKSPIGTGESAYLGLLLDDDEPGATAALCITLSERERCVFTYDCLSTDAATCGLFEQLRATGWTLRRRRRNPVFQVELPDSYEQYLTDHKSGRSRQTLRRKERALEQAYHVEVVRHDGVAITDETLDLCARVQRESWMVRRGAAGLAHGSSRAQIRSMADAGMACVWILSLDGEAAAFVVCYVANSVVHYKYPSFSLKYPPSMSIGNYLISRLLRDVIMNGMKVVDFGHGDADYKRFWATTTRHVERVIAGRGFVGQPIALSAPLAWDIAGSRMVRNIRREFATRRDLQRADNE